MSSGYSPWWRRFLQKYFKFLFIVCPEGNYHWRWDKFCFCCDVNDQPVYIYSFKKWRKLKKKTIYLN